MKSVLKSVLPRQWMQSWSQFRRSQYETHQITANKFCKATYSQEGEDQILDRLLQFRSKGFYVDVGAHHPTRYSNTYLFYQRGWSGINIDAAPGSMRLFDRFRSRDINLEVGISGDRRELEFVVLSEAAMSSFDKETALKRASEPGYNLIGIEKLQTRRLEDILKEYVQPVQKIDFLNIDVEGLDLEVLRSNDWTRYHPDYVLVEVLAMDCVEILNSEVYQFLNAQGYELAAKTVNTLFFRSQFAERPKML